ncbi:urease accessory protein UreE [Aestuariibius insulae]|uniref:urease accessory protein UreE n=1 Tax=Aestuariibius insulae TaxID=2058287 RepID=UPI00345EC269
MGIELPVARSVEPSSAEVAGSVQLDYAARLLRRKRLVTVEGWDFLVDLPKAMSVDHGDAFILEDGRFVAVVASEEAVLEVRGDLPRLAWHIGNRHAPCEIGSDALIVQDEAVMRDMLARLGAKLRPFSAAFTPEGGAYGHGRVAGHSH